LTAKKGHQYEKFVGGDANKGRGNLRFFTMVRPERARKKPKGFYKWQFEFN
jgi:hypothetical protein